MTRATSKTCLTKSLTRDLFVIMASSLGSACSLVDYYLLQNMIESCLSVVALISTSWDWEHGWDPWRALCSHEDDVEDGLSESATVLACLDCACHGHHLDVDTVIAIAFESSW